LQAGESGNNTIAMSLRCQVSKNWLVLLIVLAVAGLTLFGIVQLSEATGHPVSRLTRDPAAVARMPLYIGLLSNIGILFWAATVGVCLFSGWQLGGSAARSERPFFVCAGLLTLLLALDDFFLFHEELMPRLLGIAENTYAIGYGAVVLGFLLVFRKRLLSSDYLLLLLALAMFAVSVGIDTLTGQTELSNLIEDGAKFSGILLWGLYFALTAGETVSRRMGRNPAGPGDGAN
jgi:hypothetical protein